MNIMTKATNIELTDAIKAYVWNKTEALGRFSKKIREARVELERATKHHTGDVFRAELTIYVPQDVIRAEETSDDLYAAIDLMIGKAKIQLEKYHEKRKSLNRQTRRVRRALKAIPAYFGYEMPEPTSEITKRKTLALSEAMTEEEAIDEMNRIRHSFFIFQNRDTNHLSIVYRREAGGYGIIEVS